MFLFDVLIIQFDNDFDDIWTRSCVTHNFDVFLMLFRIEQKQIDTIINKGKHNSNTYKIISIINIEFKIYLITYKYMQILYK